MNRLNIQERARILGKRHVESENVYRVVRSAECRSRARKAAAGALAGVNSESAISNNRSVSLIIRSAGNSTGF